jgi:hypothetical protein
MSLSMYSDGINTVDPHTMIIILLIYWLYFMFGLTDVFLFSLLDSRH